MIHNFADHSYRALWGVLSCEEKLKGRVKIIKMLLAEELYNYYYDFQFPPAFFTYKNKFDMRIKLKIIQVMSVQPVGKVLSIHDFLKQFNLSNPNKAKIKRMILNAILELQNSHLILDKFKLVDKKGEVTKVNQLKKHTLTKSHQIYFYENIGQNVGQRKRRTRTIELPRNMRKHSKKRFY